jgi:hypothetical protein
MKDDNWNWESREIWTVWYTPETLFNRYLREDVRTEKSTATIDELKRQVGVQ